MVRRIFDEHDIKCRRHKRFKVTTDSNHNKLVYPNVLDQKFNAKRPKELVGYALNKRMTADVVCRALNMAIKNKRPSQGLIVHSDRGSQYCSHAYHKIIRQHQFKGSMSGKGNHYGHSPAPCTRVSVHWTLTNPRSFDNAPIESFWSILENELVYHQDYKTRFEAISDITKYIELDYNEERLALLCSAARQELCSQWNEDSKGFRL